MMLKAASLLLVGLIVGGCASSQPVTTPITAVTPSAMSITVTSSLAPTPTPPATATNTITPTPTATSTIAPTETPSPTPRPTWTPLPTIAPESRPEAYYELLENNGGCELPCWWGFELGATTVDDVAQFYTKFDQYMSFQEEGKGYTAIYITFTDPGIENGWQTEHRFLAEDGIVVKANIIIGQHSYYQLEPLLQRFGSPAEVWMRTISDYEEDGRVPFIYTLYYPEHGILLDTGHFSAGAGTDTNMLVDCFEREDSLRIVMWDVASLDPAHEQFILDNSIGLPETQGEYVQRPIAEVSNWNTDMFFTVLSDPSRTDCLETLSEIWPTWP
jgi:hypothetical protein